MIALIGLVAAYPRFSRRFRSGAAALALVTCSAVFTQFWGGYIEGHFHFFIVVGIVVLYQDWVPFLLAIAYVAIDHGVVGTMFPEWVYNHPDAIANPWKWAVFHALLVLGEAIALIYAWKQSEKSRTQVDLVMNAAGEAILGVDADGRVAFANPAASELTARPMSKLLGSPVDELFAGFTGRAATAADDGSARSNPDRSVVRGDGSTVPVNWARSPIVAHGKVVGHVVTMMDATVQKQAEEERRKRLEQVTEVERLKELNQFKTLFINTAAHELHTPLTPLRLNVFALKEGHKGGLTEAQLQVVTVLERNVERLSALVEDVLSAARIQGNRMTVAHKPLDLGKLAIETSTSFEETARRAGVSFEVLAQPNLMVMGDARRLSQVLYNLLDNAFKFTKAGGSVSVHVGVGPGGIELQVRDTGIGLTAQEVAKLFQPFSQAHDPMEYTRSGSGLGLYISKGLIEVHGGRIWCDSPGKGKGTTFHVLLPRQGAESGWDT